MTTNEKIENHIKALQEKHRIMNSEIQKMEAMNGDQMSIIKLKKKKLLIKDQIEKFKQYLV